MVSRVLPVEGLNITDRYEVLACVVILEHTCYLCLTNSMLELLIFDTKYSFLVLKYTEVTCSTLEPLDTADAN